MPGVARQRRGLRWVILVSAALGGVGCGTARRPPVLAAQPACIVLAARTEPEGLAAERAWLHEHYPGWRLDSQGLGFDGARALDRLVVVDAEGAKHQVCFDITAWFGKF